MSEACTWEAAVGREGYIPRTGWDCLTHDSHVDQVDAPLEPCVRATCLACQAQHDCARHTSMYARYQDCSATALAGALTDANVKLAQIQKLIYNELPQLDSKDDAESARAARRIACFYRSYITPKHHSEYSTEELQKFFAQLTALSADREAPQGTCGHVTPLKTEKGKQDCE